jgi:hypothetical protein
MGKLSPEANEEIIFHHPDNSSSAIRGDVIQPPNIYVKMRIADPLVSDVRRELCR